MSDPNYPKLNLPPIKLRARRVNGVLRVWSDPRKSYIALTPEEWVRRHFVEYISLALAIPTTRIVEEFTFELNSQLQRADIVVIDNSGRPQLVVECKAPIVKLTQAVVDQAQRYNSVLGARYVIITNGINHHCLDCFNSNNITDIAELEL
ncbi:MAG: type I restriction enzyme HsdR N-terminal domain-containing protein [Rikenellaceae bacterium]